MEAPRPAHGQPPLPVAPAPTAYTDSYGIASIILALFLFTIPGLIIGLIGVSKAKRLGVSATISRVGWILNLVFLVIFSIVLAAIIAFVVANPDKIKSELSSLESVSQTTLTGGGASLQVPSSFESIESDYPDADIAHGDLLAEAYVITYRDAAIDVADNTSINDYADLSYRAFESESGYSDQTRTPLPAGTIPNANGYEVADYQIDATYEGRNYVYFLRYVRTTTHFYTIMSWTMPSYLENNQPKLVSILASFKEL